VSGRCSSGGGRMVDGRKLGDVSVHVHVHTACGKRRCCFTRRTAVSGEACGKAAAFNTRGTIVGLASRCAGAMRS
jgi:hypothetical protein